MRNKIMTFFNPLKSHILHRATARRVILRAFLVIFAIAIFPLLQLIRDDAEPKSLLSDGCARDGVDFDPLSFPARFLKPMSAYVFPSPLIPCREIQNITKHVVRELMVDQLLVSGAKSLCLGDGTASAALALQELGFANTFGMKHHPFFSLVRKRLIYELEFDDDSLDFVFSSDITTVSVPVLLVLEIERVLKGGGVAAMVVYTPWSNPSRLVKSATAISLYLKHSDVIHARTIHNSFSLVVFKKRIDWVSPFEHYQLPNECPSIIRNKPFIKHLEPLLRIKSPDIIDREFSYLSKFTDVSSRKKFTFIDVGSGQFMHSNSTNWFLSSYPVPTQAVDVYVVDHNTTVLSSYVNRPGITFVYHPGLAGNVTTANGDPAEENQGFDFLAWFREMVAPEDFVVVMMNAIGVELQLLHEMFISGGICLVDELFLRCPGNADGLGTGHTDCMNLIKDLRNSGVFVHQWLED